jgi:hypothetical protein
LGLSARHAWTAVADRAGIMRHRLHSELWRRLSPGKG